MDPLYLVEHLDLRELRQKHVHSRDEAALHLSSRGQRQQTHGRLTQPHSSPLWWVHLAARDDSYLALPMGLETFLHFPLEFFCRF